VRSAWSSLLWPFRPRAGRERTVMRRNHRNFVAIVVCLFAACAPAEQNQRPTVAANVSRATPTEPQPVAEVAHRTEVARPGPSGPTSEAVTRGLTWIVEHQLPSGGWGQGDESAEMGGGAQLRDVGNVADTCMAALALVRSGSTPSRGPYQESVRRAADF